MKRILLLLSLTSATVSLHGQDQPRPRVMPWKQQPFNVVEATIPEMQAAMKQGRVTSRELVVQYLIRIALYNRRLNGVITVNPHVLRTQTRWIANARRARCAVRCTEFPSPSKIIFRPRICRRQAARWHLIP